MAVRALLGLGPVRRGHDVAVGVEDELALHVPVKPCERVVVDDRLRQAVAGKRPHAVPVPIERRGAFETAATSHFIEALAQDPGAEETGALAKEIGFSPEGAFRVIEIGGPIGMGDVARAMSSQTACAIG